MSLRGLITRPEEINRVCVCVCVCVCARARAKQSGDLSRPGLSSHWGEGGEESMSQCEVRGHYIISLMGLINA